MNGELVDWHRKPISVLSSIIGMLVIFTAAVAAVIVNQQKIEHQSELIDRNEAITSRIDSKLSIIQSDLGVIKDRQARFREDIGEIKEQLKKAEEKK